MKIFVVASRSFLPRRRQNQAFRSLASSTFDSYDLWHPATQAEEAALADDASVQSFVFPAEMTSLRSSRKDGANLKRDLRWKEGSGQIWVIRN